MTIYSTGNEVYVNGEKVAEFESQREAVAYIQKLAMLNERTIEGILNNLKGCTL